MASKTFVAQCPVWTDGVTQGVQDDTVDLRSFARVAWTDGAARRNGKPECECRWGVYWGADDANNDCGRPEGPQSNQVAELTAVQVAVDTVSCQDAGQRPSTLLIVTDSWWVVMCLTTWHVAWRRKSWTKADGSPPAHLQRIRHVLESLRKLTDTGTRVALQHVTSHARKPTDPVLLSLWHGNREADNLAACALVPDGPPESPSA